MHVGRVVGTLAFNGEEKLNINIPATGMPILAPFLQSSEVQPYTGSACAGKPSDSVSELKNQLVTYMSQHAASNLATDEGDA